LKCDDFFEKFPKSSLDHVALDFLKKKQNGEISPPEKSLVRISDFYF
jgi:hypothetical protein